MAKSKTVAPEDLSEAEQDAVLRQTLKCILIEFRFNQEHLTACNDALLDLITKVVGRDFDFMDDAKAYFALEILKPENQSALEAFLFISWDRGFPWFYNAQMKPRLAMRKAMAS